MNPPVVSVIIPTYNGEKYLGEAIDSVLSQTYRDYELIVIDDGSATDTSKKICDKYPGRVKYIRQENKGVAAARNTGIRAACGEYVAFLDDDDMWTEDKLEKQMHFVRTLENNSSKPGLVYSGLIYVNEAGGELFRLMYRSSGNNYRSLLNCDFVGTPSSVLMAKNILEGSGFFDETLKAREDYDLWLRIAHNHPIYALPEFLVKHRERKGSMSRDPEKMITGLQKIFEKAKTREQKNGEMDKQVFEKRVRSEIALRWKNAAYDWLLENNNPTMFRECIWKGRSLDSSLFGFKVRAYYFLSFISPALCIFINRLRQPRKMGTRIVEVS